MPRPETIYLVLAALASAAILLVLWRKNVIRPDSFPDSPKSQRDVSSVPTPIWLLCAAMVYLTLIEAGIMISQLKESTIGPVNTPRHDAIVAMAMYGASLIVGILMVYLVRDKAGDKSGLTVRGSDLPRGLAAALIIAPICIIALWLSQQLGNWRGAPSDPLAHTTLREIVNNQTSVWGWVLAAAAVFGAPIVEEIIYRAFLQSCLLSVLGRTWPAIIGTSALFAAMHYVGGGPVPLHALPPLFLLSICLGVAYERTRRLGVPIVMHMLFNAANVAVAILTQTQR